MNLNFARPSERLDEVTAANMLADLWGVCDATLDRLNTEGDDSLRETVKGSDYLLRVAHPAGTRSTSTCRRCRSRPRLGRGTQLQDEAALRAHLQRMP